MMVQYFIVFEQKEFMITIYFLSCASAKALNRKFSKFQKLNLVQGFPQKTHKIKISIFMINYNKYKYEIRGKFIK